jgi:hypothetical protein
LEQIIGRMEQQETTAEESGDKASSESENMA